MRWNIFDLGRMTQTCRVDGEECKSSDPPESLVPQNGCGFRLMVEVKRPPCYSVDPESTEIEAVWNRYEGYL